MPRVHLGTNRHDVFDIERGFDSGLSWFIQIRRLLRRPIAFDCSLTIVRTNDGWGVSTSETFEEKEELSEIGGRVVLTQELVNSCVSHILARFSIK